MNAKQQAAARPFGHTVIVRPTDFRAPDSPEADQRIEFHRLYEALVADSVRNQLICDDLLSVVQEGRSPLLLTERVEHLQQLAQHLSGKVPCLTVLQGGMGKKELQRATVQMAASPANPQRDYAASVRRLLRDGVDTPLADLFVYAARRLSADADGAARARSASEAFVYRRLETLSETAGRFRLNARLPIPFDAEGEMEVDLYCSEAQVAVELDEPQHLANLEAYRRDRRKDALLQANGCFVLRFLAEDLGKYLDNVLDTILRGIAYQRRRINHG